MTRTLRYTLHTHRITSLVSKWCYQKSAGFTWSHRYWSSSWTNRFPVVSLFYNTTVALSSQITVLTTMTGAKKIENQKCSGWIDDGHRLTWLAQHGVVLLFIPAVILDQGKNDLVCEGLHVADCILRQSWISAFLNSCIFSAIRWKWNTVFHTPKKTEEANQLTHCIQYIYAFNYIYLLSNTKDFSSVTICVDDIHFNQSNMFTWYLYF